MKSNPVFSEFNEFFLICHAVVIARMTNLNILKDYLPQLLENEQTVSCSHYKRLIDWAAFRFSILQNQHKIS